MIALPLALVLAAEPGRVAVFAASAKAPATAASVEVSVAQGLASMGLPLIDLERVFPAPPLDGRGAGLLADAQRAFDDLDSDRAEQLAGQALLAFAEHPEAVGAELLARAHFLLGAGALQHGKLGKRRADEAFQRAALALPTLPVDARVFGPDVSRAWRKAVRAVEARPLHGLTFSSTPPGATVEFRGQIVGVTPVVTAIDVPEGTHFVRFTKVGFRPVGIFGEITSNLEATATLPPLPAHDGVRRAISQVILKPDGQGPDDQVAIDIARRVGARYLVLVSVAPTSTGVLEVWDIESRNRLKDVAVSANPRSALDAVKRFIDGTSVLPREKEREVATVEEPAMSRLRQTHWVFRRWWFWAAVGGVAAGAATAGLVAVANGPQPPPPWNPVLDLR